MPEQKAKMASGLIAVGYAPATVTEDQVSYGSVTYLPSFEAGGRQYNATPRGDTQKVYADSTAVYGNSVNDGYDVTLTLLAVTDNVNKAWLNEQEADGGTVEVADGKEYPYFALVLIENTSDGTGKTTIFFFCQCSNRPSLSGKTAEGSTFDFEFPEYPIAATPRPGDNFVRLIKPGKEKIQSIPTGAE